LIKVSLKEKDQDLPYILQAEDLEAGGNHCNDDGALSAIAFQSKMFCLFNRVMSAFPL
jgi:hypothetical protein